MLIYDAATKTFKLDGRVRTLDREGVLRLVAEASDALVASRS